MSNVLSEEKKKQVIALGQLGWALRRIEKETGIRRETASCYLKAAGIEIRRSGGWGKAKAKPANEVTPDSTAPGVAKPANPEPAGRLSASNCEPYREVIEQALSTGRNAKSIWQDL